MQLKQNYKFTQLIQSAVHKMTLEKHTSNGKRKSNKDITLTKDDKKSYVYIHDRQKGVGYLYWDYHKKKWCFEDWQIDSSKSPKETKVPYCFIS